MASSAGERKTVCADKTARIEDYLHFLAEHFALSSPYSPGGNRVGRRFCNKVKC